MATPEPFTDLALAQPFFQPQRRDLLRAFYGFGLLAVLRRTTWHRRIIAPVSSAGQARGA